MVSEHAMFLVLLPQSHVYIAPPSATSQEGLLWMEPKEEHPVHDYEMLRSSLEDTINI